MADRTVSVRLKAEIDKYLADLRKAGQGTLDLSKKVDAAGKRSAQAIAALPAAAATAGTATAAALGGVSAAFVGLGAVALRENEAVKTSFQDLADTINTGIAQDAQPLADEFVGAADQIEAAYMRLRPQLQQAFEASQPYVEDLTGAVTDFAENAMPGAVDAVESAGPVFEGLRDLAGDAGDGVSEFFSVLSQHSEEAGQGIEHFGDLAERVLPKVAGIIGDLTDVWAEHGDEVVDAASGIVSVLGDLSGGALPVLADAAGAAAEAVGGIVDVLGPMADEIGPLIGMWATLAATMKGMRGIRGILQRASVSATNFGRSMHSAGRRAKVGSGLVVAGLTALASTLSNVLGDDDYVANLDALTLGLERWARQSTIAGEAARFLGDDAKGLRSDFEVLGRTTTDLQKPFTDLAEMIGIDTDIQDAKDSIATLDGALAQMVKDGNAEAAASVLDRVSRLANEAGISTEELTSMLPDYSAAQEVAGEETGKTGDAMEVMGDKAGGAQEQIREMVTALQEATESAFAARSAEVDYEAAVDKASEAVSENGATLDINTEAGRNNRTALDSLAQSALDHAQAMVDDGVALDTVHGKMETARDQFIRTATQMGHSESEARQLARSLGLIPGNYHADVFVRVGSSVVGVASSIESALGFADGGIVERASGGQVPRFPSGGMVSGPGGPRDDSILARVSDGEYVVNAQATDRHLPLLEAINAGRFATGGLVGGGGTIGGGGVVNQYYTVHAPNYVGTQQDLVRALRREVRTRGHGSVQEALGS